MSMDVVAYMIIGENDILLFKIRPIRVKGAKKHKEVEELLRKANETPINPHFEHPPKQHD